MIWLVLGSRSPFTDVSWFFGGPSPSLFFYPFRRRGTIGSSKVQASLQEILNGVIVNLRKWDMITKDLYNPNVDNIPHSWDLGGMIALWHWETGRGLLLLAC